jgi:hypothetical protein
VPPAPDTDSGTGTAVPAPPTKGRRAAGRLTLPSAAHLMVDAHRERGRSCLEPVVPAVGVGSSPGWNGDSPTGHAEGSTTALHAQPTLCELA